MDRIGENRVKFVTGETTTWHPVITTAQNAGGVVVRTLATLRTGNGGDARGRIRVVIGANNYLIWSDGQGFGSYMHMETLPLQLPPGAQLEYFANDNDVEISCTWDDLP